jgi:uncharacterized protein (DUF2141 family)
MARLLTATAAIVWVSSTALGQSTGTELTEPPVTAKVVIQLTNVPAATTLVVSSLFNSEDTFLTEYAAYFATAKPTGDGTATIVFDDVERGSYVAVGSYGVVVVADEDGNQRLSFKMLFLPNEHYGFGNNATGFMGPASFEDASVEVTAPVTQIEIQLKAPPLKSWL